MRGGRSRVETVNAADVQRVVVEHSPAMARRNIIRCNRMEMEEFIKTVKDIIFQEREVVEPGGCRSTSSS